MKPGPRNLITDVAGLSVGNAENSTLKSGVTAIICEKEVTASVAVHGGGPGTRDAYLLEPENTVEHVDAIALSGGSAFGLDACSGVQAWMRKEGRGFTVGSAKVPIVPGAILFDLINGGSKEWGKFPPYQDLGWEAAANASSDFQVGSVGAGTGALVAGVKGGLGSASLVLGSGITIAALFAVNAVGSPLFGNTRYFRAASFEKENEFGGLGFPKDLPDNLDHPSYKFRNAAEGSNTTIGVIATDAKLTKAQVKRLAIAAHDGIANAIWPAHTPMDGDLVFGLATGRGKSEFSASEWLSLSAHAASVSARAIARGVYCATAQENDMFPVYRDKFKT